MLTVDRSKSTPACPPPGRGAARLELRPLEPSDLWHLTSLFDHLSARSRYLRFFTPTPKVPAATLRYLAAVDHRHHEAVGAFNSGTLVGAAHYLRDTDCPSRAELCVEVADPHQGRGLGTDLLHDLAHRAQRRGITQFTATVMAENRAAVALIRGTGWTIATRIDGPNLELVLSFPRETNGRTATSTG